jgi:glycosyltransferase involved in cell wall biosynthesis
MNNTNNRIRVLQVTGTLFIGGAEKVIVSLVKEMDRTRFDVAVCCTRARGPLTEVVTAAGVPVILAMNPKRSHYLRPLDLRPVLADLKPDVVHSHGLQAMGTVAPLAMCGLIPHWIHTFHFGNYPYEKRRHMFLERLYSRWVDQLVAVAEPQRQAIIKHHGVSPDRIVTLANGVPDNPFVNDPDVRRRKREELGIPHDAFLIGTIAVLTEQKGIRYLIDAARQVLAVMPSARFMIVGSGHLSDSLRAEVDALGLSSSILFTGWRMDGAELLMTSDAYVMPSLWEAMPLALLEAMAAARPIVVTDVGDNRRIVRNGEVAVLVPPKDASALAQALLDLARDPARAQKLSALARRAFVEEYMLSRMIARYEAMYERDRTLRQPQERARTVQA